MADPRFERFLANVQEDEGGCWLWVGTLIPGGYGKFTIAGRTKMAHRWWYDVNIGIKDPKNVVAHLCDVKKCVNLDHLREQTQKQNLAYSRRHLDGKCHRGHDASNFWVEKNGKNHCNACRRERRRAAREAKETNMGDIGNPLRHIELEPIPETAPVEAPEVTPAQEPVPA